VRKGRIEVNVQIKSRRDSLILFFMRKEREPERKSARLEKRRKVPTPSVSPRRGQGCHIGRLSGKSRPKDVVRARPDERPSRPTAGGRPLADGPSGLPLADGPGGRPVLRQSAQPPYRKTARNIITFFNFFSPLQGSPSSTVAPRVTPQSYFLL
jgi:hypothetical protein